MKKEHYRRHLPHFHTPGQFYFVTWCLRESVPVKAVDDFSIKIRELKSIIQVNKENKKEPEKIARIEKELFSIRKKYINAFNKMLDNQKHPDTNLSNKNHIQIIKHALNYWNNYKINNIAFSIMPNHVHWVLETYEKDHEGRSVYLQDVLKSVKQFTAYQINKSENKEGPLWHKESFDITIRDEAHLSRAISYTLNNPVKARLSKTWDKWPGNWCDSRYIDCI